MSSRIPPIALTDVPAALAPDFDIILKSNGYIPESYKVLAHRPPILKAFMDLSKAVIRDEGTVDRGFRFLVAYVSSRTRGCQYCQAHNAKSAARWGVPDAKLDAVWSYETSDLYSAEERVALEFAQAAAQTPNLVTDDLVARVRHHWSDAQVVEIMSVVSLFGWLNCFNDGLTTDLDQATLDWAADFGLAEKTGWDPTDHLTAPR